jgi:hypothetical protein
MKASQLSLYVALKPEEEVLDIVREPLAPHLLKFFGLGFLLLLPFFLMFPLFALGWFGALLFLVLIAVAVAIGVRTYVSWDHTVLIVTDRRLIDIDRRGLFDRVVTQAPFSQIDEVSYRVHGLAPTLFKYGSVRVQLSGSAADIEFKRAPSPSRLHDLINDLRKVIADEERDREERRVRILTRKMRPEELAKIERDVRDREVQEGLETLYEGEEKD